MNGEPEAAKGLVDNETERPSGDDATSEFTLGVVELGVDCDTSRNGCNRVLLVLVELQSFSCKA